MCTYSLLEIGTGGYLVQHMNTAWGRTSQSQSIYSQAKRFATDCIQVRKIDEAVIGYIQTVRRLDDLRSEFLLRLRIL